MSPSVIVALDVASRDDARAIVNALGDACDFYKVGSELFTAAGPSLVQELADSGHVFLDLKLHDIPNTVRGAARCGAALGARLLTVHASGGRAMIEAAVDGAAGRCGVLAVTILTSLDAGALGEAWGRQCPPVAQEVVRLAGLAAESGASGIVCSGVEAPLVRERYGAGLELLIPGIRLPGGPSHDQRRVVTARDAADAGATYVVVGRAVTEAADPRAALASIREALS